MKAYLITTAALFALITGLHVWRAFVEPHLARDFWFILITLVAASMSLWAWRLLRGR
jgi:hypothetical protein